jgi:hypothetical protein
MGIAKLRFCPPFKIKVLMPITYPCELKSGLPEFPEEITKFQKESLHF